VPPPYARNLELNPATFWRFSELKARPPVVAGRRGVSAPEIATGKIFTSFVVLACCKFRARGGYRKAARAPPCGNKHKALRDSQAKSLRGRLIKEELLYEAFDPQAFDVLEMPAIIGEEGEIVLAGCDADNKIEVGDTLSLRA